jgi:hypothetical protein
MVVEAFGRDVVRKYWLMHDLMRALALKRMEDVEFAGGDLHRQRVRWEGGGEVIVNRGASNWESGERTLPQYGFYAHVPQAPGGVEVSVERKDGKTVEWSRSAAMMYVNGRGETADFGAVETAGAARLTRDGDSLIVTALPDGGDFAIRLRWSQLPWKLSTPRQAEALDESGNVASTERLESSGGNVVLNYKRGVFAYRLR